MILEAGCGDGVVLKALCNLKNSCIVGCDYNLLRSKRAKSACPDALIINSDLRNISFKKRSFQIIIINHVLEHIQEDMTVLCNLSTLLKDDGILILGAPNEGCFLGYLRNHYIQRWILRQTDHAHFYTERELVSKIYKAGFDILDIQYDSFMFPHSRINDLLASFEWGFYLLTFLGKIFKSQCAGLYFICAKKGYIK
jgi:2-polyprenyl-3-methyl-5-hydroxy-6-metoxy-1,4-benzoquinol methylase